MTTKKPEPKGLSTEEKLALLIDLLKRNGLSIPKELDEAAD